MGIIGGNERVDDYFSTIIETEQGQGNRFRVRGGFGLPWRESGVK